MKSAQFIQNGCVVGGDGEGGVQLPPVFFEHMLNTGLEHEPLIWIDIRQEKEESPEGWIRGMLGTQLACCLFVLMMQADDIGVDRRDSRTTTKAYLSNIGCRVAVYSF